MFGLPIGVFVEGAVAILLVMTIGYCAILNERLKRLHADRDMMRQMVADLFSATNLANQAIKELKASAVEADLQLGARLDEAGRFGVELANHVNAGTALMERIAKITSLARQSQAGEAGVPVEPVSQPNRLNSALEQLATRARARGEAA